MGKPASSSDPDKDPHPRPPARHWLAATDFSAASLHALDRAARLAAELGGQCTVSHVIDPGGFEWLDELLGAKKPVTVHAIEQNARELLTRLASGHADQYGVSIATRLEMGPPAVMLANAAQATGATLVAIGSHGESVIERVLMGSTTIRLLRKSRTPVLVVKQAPAGPYQRVLVPVDFSAASVPSIRLAKAIAPGARMILLHVFDLPYEGKLRYAGIDHAVILQHVIDARKRLLDQLQQLASAAGLGSNDFVAQVVHGGAVREIRVAEQAHECDLIVLGKHGRNLAEKLLLGSVTSSMLAESDADVLVIVDHDGEA